MSCSSFVGRLIGGRPKCRTFYLEIDPEAFVFQLPSVFYRRFRHELSSKVFFKDNHGNEVELALERGLLDGLIIDGYMQLCNFYNLDNGGWLKVYYCGDGVFRIRVRDIDMCRVRYPYPPRRLSLGQPIGNDLHDVVIYDAIPQALPDPFVQSPQIPNPVAHPFLSDSQAIDAPILQPIVAQLDPIFPPLFQHSHNPSEVSASNGEGIDGHAARNETNPQLTDQLVTEGIDEATAETADQPTAVPFDVALNDIDNGTASKEVKNADLLDTFRDHISADHHQTNPAEDPGAGFYQFDILITGVDSNRNAEVI